MKCTIDGVKYKSVDDKSGEKGCSLCAGNDGDGSLCELLGRACTEKQIYWVKKEPSMKAVINGISYKAIPEKVCGSCSGCHFNVEDIVTTCDNFAEIDSYNCLDRGIIWTKHEKKPKKKVSYVNVYADDCLHETKEIADAEARLDRIACVRVEY